MTEITDITRPQGIDRFILYWGDMGSQWGVNRSVAQVHALLYLAPEPMHAEQIAHALGIARSNVSNSLKELVAWRLIRRVPIAGDRREHFAAEVDLWEMALRIAQGRREREIDPAKLAIAECVALAQGDASVDPVAMQRLTEMQRFLDETTHWYDQMRDVPTSQLKRLLGLGDKVIRLLKFAGANKK
ncbi:DNA-binding transcriptional regulator GbsR, MarR family [Yoonia tamlensis]|uniref:HTH-type transcriptional regulator n=1 Tax=Yoonia tamlensis TaxID=390270 RepID=A0A1I6FTH5_9RHOB|nr:MarR family transcriptional regulator [Yoonia tamlensis]SFR33252.1 DNA-binding transcriptional regulator GbsR, MarR family [Yoonia tamlensis]